MRFRIVSTVACLVAIVASISAAGSDASDFNGLAFDGNVIYTKENTSLKQVITAVLKEATNIKNES